MGGSDRVDRRPLNMTVPGARMADAWYVEALNPHLAASTTARALCVNWGKLRTGPQGPPGRPGPPGEIADQRCPAENMFVYGVTDGKIDCAYLNIVP